MPREFVFDQSVHQFGNSRMIETVDDFIKESADEKLFRDGRRDSAREEIEHLVFPDLAGGGAVAAFHVVGEDLQAGMELASASSLRRRLRTVW